MVLNSFFERMQVRYSTYGSVTVIPVDDLAGRLTAGNAAMPRLAAMGGLGWRFNRLWGAVIVSDLGDGVMLVAFPLLVASITAILFWSPEPQLPGEFPVSCLRRLPGRS